MLMDNKTGVMPTAALQYSHTDRLILSYSTGDSSTLVSLAALGLSNESVRGVTRKAGVSKSGIC